MNFPVDFVGEPVPQVKWSINGKPLPDKIQIENKEGLTNLYFPMAKRADSGPYHLEVKNELGKDEADFDIVIQGLFYCVLLCVNGFLAS